MKKRKVIIDTDCGGDDAIGIMAALVSKSVEVVAITTCWGNVNVDQGMENMGKLLDLFNADIPLYRGAAGPLMGERETVPWGGFGVDGFGDADFPTPSRHAASKKHAALALIDIINAGEGDSAIYQLITLGPLTNVALALRLDPYLFDKLGSSDCPGLIMMAGAMESKGNSNLAAEFNVHCDPEAARIVFLHRGLPSPFWLVTWEMTVNCAMPWSFFDKWLNRVNGTGPRMETSAIQTFILKMFAKLEAFTRPADDGTKADTGDAESTQDVTCVIPDAVAVAAAILTRDFVLESIDTFVTVELTGRETRGATCIDWYGNEQSMQKKGRWRNCKVITKCDVGLFLRLMQEIVDFPLQVKR